MGWGGCRGSGGDCERDIGGGREDIETTRFVQGVSLPGAPSTDDIPFLPARTRGQI